MKTNKLKGVEEGTKFFIIDIETYPSFSDVIFKTDYNKFLMENRLKKINKIMKNESK